MNKIPFNKPALSVSQQISKLEGCGLIVNDKSLAENALRNLNYYRLSGYWMYFEDNRNLHHFKKGTKFEDILDLYNFEKELRSFIFEGISRFEVSLRTQYAHQLSMKYGSGPCGKVYLDFEKEFTIFTEAKDQEGRAEEDMLKNMTEKERDAYFEQKNRQTIAGINQQGGTNNGN